MKALVKKSKGIKNIGLVEKEIPVCKNQSVIIKIKACGICGTDMHIIKDEYPIHPPVTIGHEFSGEIFMTGKEVVNYSPGDRVVSHTAVSTCGECTYCKQGLIMLCSQRKSIGSGVDGAFAEYISVPASSLYKFPDYLSFNEAALTEPLACVVRCLIERSNIKVGDSVLISGPGTMGILALQVAKESGADVTMIGSEQDEERLALALSLGAKSILKAGELPSRSAPYDSFDIAIECAGAASSLNNCIKFLKKQGNLIQLGLFGREILVDADQILMKELNVSNGFATTPKSWEIAINLLELRKIKLEPLISYKYDLNDWKEAVSKVKDNKGFKTLLIPS